MSELIEILLVFLKIGLLAFGGVLAVLPEMQREVVDQHGWITEREFVDGFALGQLTPGPGMLMVMFIGYQAAGIAGALTALAGLFLPPALLSACAAAWWDRLRLSPWIAAAQQGFGPVALGLIGSGAYTLLRSAVGDWLSAIVVAVTILVLWRWRPNPALVILPAGLATLLVELAGRALP